MPTLLTRFIAGIDAMRLAAHGTLTGKGPCRGHPVMPQVCVNVCVKRADNLSYADDKNPTLPSQNSFIFKYLCKIGPGRVSDLASGR